ncbi:DUF4381 domain-containing protein [Pseudomonas sp. PSKL.D1]|uniref:DUF4381 domain-containing protein n=1 Tax=Pseudomonas sp. PSKL.D1 TaxID=3029060 RepID=UPI00238147F7|nr:DUF4381 domain-containing protein [Pseudomonas sp. PSKL.D1]WDY56111.1 DUF4381 domain-containing protein [Pseudomonas sp. PSKL.D1]
MSAAAPAIDQLRELAPGMPPFSYLPHTWAWLVLAVLVLMLLGLWAALRWRHWQRNRYRREALARLDAMASSEGDQRLIALRGLPELLKRVALSMPGAPPVASLGGAQWQTFLEQRAPQPLPAGFTDTLHLLAYAPDTALRTLDAQQVSTLFMTSRGWIEGHHVAV